jgi:hypothetical protein
MARMPIHREVLELNTSGKPTDAFGLIDRLTVTFGYAELLEMDPANVDYQDRLHESIVELASVIHNLERSFA